MGRSLVWATDGQYMGFIPIGNTGGTSVSPFQVLPVDPKLAAIIAKANSSKPN